MSVDFIPPPSAPRPHPAILAYGEAMVEYNQVKGGNGRDFLQGFGGDTSNFLIAAARQGATCGYLSALGVDAAGQSLRALWDAEGVDHTHVIAHETAPTGLYFVTHGATGHAFSFARKGSAASLYRPADAPLEAIRTAKVLHLSGISLAISESACDAAYAMVEAARAAGLRISFDTNLRLKLWSIHRARAIMRDMLTLTDLALPSYEDVAAITGLEKPEAIVDHLLGLGTKIVALKLGAEGALLADAHRRVRIPPFPCQPVDATGAGDCFGGAFIARLVLGDEWEAAGRYAAAAAALSTQGYGAVAPIPRAEAVQAAMRARG